MKQIAPDATAHKSSHPRAATAAATNVIRPPLTTIGQYDHVAAAAYLMKHAGVTALTVVNARTGQPAGIITEADIDRAIADGKDINDFRVHAVMTAREAPSPPSLRKARADELTSDASAASAPEAISASNS